MRTPPGRRERAQCDPRPAAAKPRRPPRRRRELRRRAQVLITPSGRAALDRREDRDRDRARSRRAVRTSPSTGGRSSTRTTSCSVSELPATMVVVGAGVIGSSSHRCSRRSARGDGRRRARRLLDFCDREIVDALRFHLRERNVSSASASSSTRVEEREDGTLTTLASGKRIAAEAVFYSAGRQGATADARPRERGSRGRRARPHRGRRALPHRGAAHLRGRRRDRLPEPRLDLRRAGPPRRRATPSAMPTSGGEARLPYGIYSIPEIRSSARRRIELTEAVIPYEVGVAHYREIARGQILGDTHGLLKLLVSRRRPDAPRRPRHRRERDRDHPHRPGGDGLGGTIDYFVDTSSTTRRWPRRTRSPRSTGSTSCAPSALVSEEEPSNLVRRRRTRFVSLAARRRSRATRPPRRRTTTPLPFPCPRCANGRPRANGDAAPVAAPASASERGAADAAAAACASHLDRRRDRDDHHRERAEAVARDRHHARQRSRRGPAPPESRAECPVHRHRHRDTDGRPPEQAERPGPPFADELERADAEQRRSQQPTREVVDAEARGVPAVGRAPGHRSRGNRVGEQRAGPSEAAAARSAPASRSERAPPQRRGEPAPAQCDSSPPRQLAWAHGEALPVHARPDARAARGARRRRGADGPPPRRRLPRDLRADARAASRRSSAPRARCCSSRASGTGAMESAVTNLSAPGRPRRRRRRGRVRRALGQDLRAPRPRRAAHRLRVGRGARSRRDRRRRRRERRRHRPLHAVRDLDRRRRRRAGAQGRRRRRELVVDAISSLGAVPLETDAWGSTSSSPARRRR